MLEASEWHAIIAFYGLYATSHVCGGYKMTHSLIASFHCFTAQTTPSAVKGAFRALSNAVDGYYLAFAVTLPQYVTLFCQFAHVTDIPLRSEQ